MTKNRIELPDGRYLIYYRFEDEQDQEASAPCAAAGAEAVKENPPSDETNEAGR